MLVVHSSPQRDFTPLSPATSIAGTTCSAHFSRWEGVTHSQPIAFVASTGNSYSTAHHQNYSAVCTVQLQHYLSQTNTSFFLPSSCSTEHSSRSTNLVRLPQPAQRIRFQLTTNGPLLLLCCLSLPCIQLSQPHTQYTLHTLIIHSMYYRHMLYYPSSIHHSDHSTLPTHHSTSILPTHLSYTILAHTSALHSPHSPLPPCHQPCKPPHLGPTPAMALRGKIGFICYSSSTTASHNRSTSRLSRAFRRVTKHVQSACKPPCHK